MSIQETEAESSHTLEDLPVTIDTDESPATFPTEETPRRLDLIPDAKDFIPPVPDIAGTNEALYGKPRPFREPTFPENSGITSPVQQDLRVLQQIEILLNHEPLSLKDRAALTQRINENPQAEKAHYIWEAVYALLPHAESILSDENRAIFEQQDHFDRTYKLHDKLSEKAILLLQNAMSHGEHDEIRNVMDNLYDTLGISEEESLDTIQTILNQEGNIAIYLSDLALKPYVDFLFLMTDTSVMDFISLPSYFVQRTEGLSKTEAQREIQRLSDLFFSTGVPRNLMSFLAQFRSYLAPNIFPEEQSQLDNKTTAILESEPTTTEEIIQHAITIDTHIRKTLEPLVQGAKDLFENNLLSNEQEILKSLIISTIDSHKDEIFQQFGIHVDNNYTEILDKVMQPIESTSDQITTLKRLHDLYTRYTHEQHMTRKTIVDPLIQSEKAADKLSLSQQAHSDVVIDQYSTRMLYAADSAGVVPDKIITTSHRLGTAGSYEKASQNANNLLGSFEKSLHTGDILIDENLIEIASKIYENWLETGYDSNTLEHMPAAIQDAYKAFKDNPTLLEQIQIDSDEGKITDNAKKLVFAALTIAQQDIDIAPDTLDAIEYAEHPRLKQLNDTFRWIKVVLGSLIQRKNNN